MAEAILLASRVLRSPTLSARDISSRPAFDSARSHAPCFSGSGWPAVGEQVRDGAEVRRGRLRGGFGEDRPGAVKLIGSVGQRTARFRPSLSPAFERSSSASPICRRTVSRSASSRASSVEAATRRSRSLVSSAIRFTADW